MERLYKVLTHDAKSAHGGIMDWTDYLPKYKWNNDFSGGEWTTGKWYRVKGELSMCQNGIHLTSHPLRWKVKRGRIFLAEWRGEHLKDNTDKSCFKEVRLICELGIDSFDLDVKIWKSITSSADLRSADLSSADLSSADLRSANLRSANLRSADLRWAISLEGCYIDADPKIKGYKFNNERLWKTD